MYTDSFVLVWNLGSVLVFFASVLCTLPNTKVRTFILPIAGFFWGASHSAPISQNSHPHVEVVQKNLISLGSGMLVKTKVAFEVPHEKIFYATGSGRLQSSGTVTYFPKTSIYPPDRNVFQEHFPDNKTVFTPLFVELDTRISTRTPEVRGFVSSVLLGDKTELSSQVLNAFKKLGIYHLLVVSGLHLTFLSTFFVVAIFSPFQTAYSLCLINPRIWFYLRFPLRITCMLVIFLYASAIGFPPSVQRAAMLFFGDQSVKMLGFTLSVKERIMSALFLQSILFPLDLLNLGSLLSWTSYLTVYTFALCKNKTWKELALCQLTLTFSTGALLGQLSVAGFFLNVIVVPLFPFVVFWIFPLIAPEYFPKGFSIIGEGIQILFLNSMTSLAKRISAFPFLYFDISQSECLRGFLLVFSFFLFFLLQKRMRQIPEIL